MCGRYTLSVSNKPAIAELGLQSADRFNIAPQSQVLIQTDSGDHESVHWGIPMGGSKASRFVTNARFETLDAKPLFRDAARCALLTDGWYEWQRVGSKKQPWYHHRGGRLFYMAGVYQSGVGCAVVTQSASETLTEIHHRQPVVLGAHDLNFWLNGAASSDELPALEISYHPVSTRVGSTRYDDSSLIAPVDLDGATVGQTADLFSGDKRFSAEDGKR
jgi:putative SOS response-associated peptidase YedK